MLKRWFREIPDFAYLSFPIITILLTYFTNRSLFVDEASLALNLMERDFQALLGTLDYGQAAPIGFLLVSKLIVSLFGFSEYSLRLLPLILGLLACFLIFKLSQRIVPRAMPFIMFWFGTSNYVMRFATEYKQYIGDMMFSLLLLLLADYIYRNSTYKYIILWGIVAIISVWFSHPAVFVIAGSGIMLMFYLYRDRRRSEAIAVFIVSIISAMNLFIVYLFFYRQVAYGTDVAEFMQTFWEDSFFELSPEWFLRFPFILFRSIAHLNNPILVIVVIFGFIVGIRLIERRFGLILLLITILTLIASGLHLYPLRERLLLFLLPGVVFILASGLEDVYAKVKRANQSIATIILLGILALFLYQINPGQYLEETRLGYEYVYSVSSEEPIVFISYESERVARYYNYPYRVLSRLSIEEVLDHAESSDNPVWMVIIQRHLFSFPLEELEELSAHFNFHEIYVLCFDGLLTMCPELDS